MRRPVTARVVEGCKGEGQLCCAVARGVAEVREYCRLSSLFQSHEFPISRRVSALPALRRRPAVSPACSSAIMLPSFEAGDQRRVRVATYDDTAAVRALWNAGAVDGASRRSCSPRELKGRLDRGWRCQIRARACRQLGVGGVSRECSRRALWASERPFAVWRRERRRRK